MILYILKSALCLALLLAVYHVLLVRVGAFRFNRFFLVFSLCFSLITPLVQVDIVKEAIVNDLPVVSAIDEFEDQFVPFSSSDTEIPIFEDSTYTNDENAPNYMRVTILSLYLIVMIFLVVRYIRNISKLIQRQKRSDVICYKSIPLNLVEENTAPHSFLNCIFISKIDYETGVDEQLLTHELAHVRQKHSLDILFVELLKMIFWINPILILYSTAIRINHEYLADQEVIKRYNSVVTYQNRLLEYLALFKSESLACQLNYSLTKARFKMMKKKISKTGLTISIALLLPILLFALLAFSPAVRAYEEEVSNRINEIQENLNLTGFTEKNEAEDMITAQNEMIRLSEKMVENSELINSYRNEVTRGIVQMPYIEPKKDIVQNHPLEVFLLDSTIIHNQPDVSDTKKQKKEEYPYGLPIIINKVFDDITVIKRVRKYWRAGIDVFDAPIVFIDGERVNGLSDVDIESIGTATIVGRYAAKHKFGSDGKYGALLIDRTNKDPKVTDNRDDSDWLKNLKIENDPVSDVMRVTLECPREQKISIYVYRPLEKILLKNVLRKKMNMGENTFEWNVSKEKQGLYFMIVLSGGERIFRKFIISRNAPNT